MAPSSSGGTTVGEALNILENTDLAAADEQRYLHRLIESSRLSFADRGRWLGDPAFEDVPTRELLSQRFADSRECLIRDDAVLSSPVAPGDPRDPAACRTGGAAAPTTYEGESTTHLTTADRWGNVVAYTLTIEQTGGSGITVPGRGFLLNNELTDFSFAPAAPGVHDPNLPGPGKRPRSSMSPTIVLDADRRPVVALGSPGGSTIITTVLQTLTNHLDRGMPLAEAIAAPRVSQRNTATTQMEPGLWDDPVRQRLEALGHRFARNPEIGAVTGIRLLPDGRWLAAAEKERRGGGSAMVVDERKRGPAGSGSEGEPAAAVRCRNGGSAGTVRSRDDDVAQPGRPAIGSRAPVGPRGNRVRVTGSGAGTGVGRREEARERERAAAGASGPGPLCGDGP